MARASYEVIRNWADACCRAYLEKWICLPLRTTVVRLVFVMDLGERQMSCTVSSVKEADDLWRETHNGIPGACKCGADLPTNSLIEKCPSCNADLMPF